MNLSGYDLQVIADAIDDAPYGKIVRTVDELEGVAFCRAPVRVSPGHKYLCSIETAAGTIAQIFRTVHNEVDRTHGDELERLREHIQDSPHHELCTPDLFESIAYCRNGRTDFNDHTFIFQMTTPNGRRANVFRVHG